MNEETSHLSNGASFADYGTHFQEKVVQCLLSDPVWSEQMMEVINPSYFEVKYLKYLVENYIKYVKKHKQTPSLKMLATIVRSELSSTTDSLLRDQVVNYLVELKEDPDVGDLPLVKEKSLEFCRKQKLKQGLLEIVALAESQNYEKMVSILQQSLAAGTSTDLGHDFFEDAETRFTALKRDFIETGLPKLDDKLILQGGSGRGELHVVIAPTGVGKSHWLTAIGANAMRQGKNVVHFTFELSESKIGIRYDSNLTNIDSNDVVERKEDVLDFYRTNPQLGKLKIKYFPTGTATTQTLRSYIDRCRLKGFQPDVILVDYADIMRSTEQMEGLRFELKKIYEELRAFAVELNVALWTASQSTKEGSESDVVDLKHMGEAYAKAHIADFIVGLSRKSNEKSIGVGRLFVAKNRNGKDGILFNIGIDTAKSQFEIYGDNVINKVADLPEGSIRSIKQRVADLNRKGISITPIGAQTDK